MLALGIDIGGTNTVFAVVRFRVGAMQILKTWQAPTPEDRAQLLEIIDAAVRRASTAVRPRKLNGVGIGIPGPLTKDRSQVLVTPNAPQLSRLALPAWITRRFRLPARMENDANVFAFAEALLGAGRGYRRVLGVTVGTGVGGGLVCDGRIVHGAHGAAGEIGHLVIAANGRRCGCGGRGHLEAYVSRRAIIREGGLEPEDLARVLRRRGGVKARDAFARAGTYLGLGLASAANLWDPDVIVIGGGISAAGEDFLKPARDAMRQELISPVTRRSLRIRKARFGRYGGAIGAALLFHEGI